ncbi:MAG: peptide ABC transporter substrate-binding protein [Oscillospiraceae bacterium]|nr:peptide ABC transporter substrate-binding protein [Oscillospiraceae bacterium]
MKIKVSFFLIFIIFFTLFLSSSCRKEDDGSNYIFKFDIAYNPRTLDPQNASGQTAAMLIANMFDGLLKIDSDGNIALNLAEKYTLSDDKLTYTFQLRDDVYWYFDGDSETICTAHDFVYAFRRLFNPAVKSENAPLFYAIKNAEKIHTENLTNLHDIGVYAADDFTLIITLEQPDPHFPYLLTTPPAMPCNEEIFLKTAGRYGLNGENLPSNGAFYLTKWHYDPHRPQDSVITMRRNNKNNHVFDTNQDNENAVPDRIYPLGLNFFISNGEPLENFRSNTTQALIATGNSDATSMLISQNFPCSGAETSVWGLVFETHGTFGNSDLRYAFAAAIERENIEFLPMKNGWRIAENLVPPVITIDTDFNYREHANDTFPPEFNRENAHAAYEKGAGMVSRENLTGLKIIMPENQAASEYLGRVLQQWQAVLGFYCTVESLPPDSFERAVLSGNFDIAFVKLTGGYNSPDAYLSGFGNPGDLLSRSLPQNTVAEYQNLLKSARLSEDIVAAAELYKQAENALLEQVYFMPICFQTEMFFYSNRSRDLDFNPFTGVVFFRGGRYF